MQAIPVWIITSPGGQHSPRSRITVSCSSFVAGFIEYFPDFKALYAMPYRLVSGSIVDNGSPCGLAVNTAGHAKRILYLPDQG